MNQSALIAFMQTLVRQQTYSGEERPGIELIAAEMQRLGFDRIWTDQHGSVVGVIEGATSGRTLLFDSHCDTVGIAPGSIWTRDPFGAQIENGICYGRGTADMKGVIAAMLHSAASVDRSKIKGRIAVSVTVMEEVIEGIALKQVMDDLHPDFVVIGEPTNLNLSHGGRGRAEIQLETIGRPAHSSSPQFGLNAVHEMIKVIDAIEHLPIRSNLLMGDAIFALCDIISDPYPGYSVIPSRCRATYDRRLLPGETPESVLSAITDHPALIGIHFKAVVTDGAHETYTGSWLRSSKFFPAWTLTEDHPLVQSALTGLRKSGLNPSLRAYRFCTNAAYSAGMAGVPTVGFGPAEEGDCHVVDERLALADLMAAAHGYQGMIEAVLG
ncbi:MAG: YgeY family selenium metabolism-linked hydrolase [Caldilineaceae bacterium]